MGDIEKMKKYTLTWAKPKIENTIMKNDFSGWKDVNGFEGKYKINRSGIVYSLISDKILGTRLNKYGYTKVVLCKNGKIYHYTMYRLVAIHFIDNHENKKEVNHKDGNKLNNTADNLEWCTNLENIRHAWENGLSKCHKIKDEQKKFMSKLHMGINNPIAKLTEIDVLKLRVDFNNKMVRKDIAVKYNISLRNVYRVGNREYYSNIL